jgi:hypothetical protein
LKNHDTIDIPARSARALGGHRLDEVRAMRIAYLDEGGISKNEPWVVVAGIIPDPDLHYHAIEDALDAIRQTLPEHRRESAIFHAMDIHHGTKAFPRAEYPDPEKRFELLRAVAGIPAALGLQVVFHHVEKEALRASFREHDWGMNFDSHAHFIAAAQCFGQVEHFMRALGEGEVAHIVAENNDNVRKRLRSVYNWLRTMKPSGDELERQVLGDSLPFRRIIDAPLFAEKRESAPLQVADVCAWAIKRKLMGAKHCEQLWEIVRPCLVRFSPPDWSGEAISDEGRSS